MLFELDASLTAGLGGKRLFEKCMNEHAGVYLVFTRVVSAVIVISQGVVFSGWKWVPLFTANIFLTVFTATSQRPFLSFSAFPEFSHIRCLDLDPVSRDEE